MSRDARVESLLKRGGYKFVYQEKIPFSQIDIKASEENPARLHRKIDGLTVTQYALSMLDGAVFPALVLLRQDKAKHLVATGMHRIKAVLEAADDLPVDKREIFDGYIVAEAGQFEFELLIRLLNSIEGRGDTQRDQLHHVVALHEKFPDSKLGDLAKRFHLKENTVFSFWNEHLGIQRASRLGFDFENNPTKQPQVTIIALNKIPSDLVYVAAANYIVRYEVSGRDADDLVRELKDVRSKGQDAEMAVIAKRTAAADAIRRRNKSRGRKSLGAECTRFIGQVRAINRKVARGIDPLKLDALPDAHTGLDDSITVVEDGIESLQKILGELQRIKRVNAAGGSGSSGYAQAAAPH